LEARQRARVPHERDAIHYRHVHVGDNQIGRMLVEPFQSLDPVASLNDAEATTFERTRDHSAHRHRIVDNENCLF
jgi:hypothetical protein